MYDSINAWIPKVEDWSSGVSSMPAGLSPSVLRAYPWRRKGAQ